MSIKKTLNPELHKNEQTISSVNIDWSGTNALFSMTALTANDTNGGRTGLRVRAHSVSAKLIFTANTTSVGSVVRTIIMVDKFVAATGSLPTIASLLDNGGSSIATLSGYNKAYGDRFKVLYDRVIHLSADSKDLRQVNITVPFKQLVRYTGTASGDEGTNQVYIAFISNEQTNTPSVVGYTTFRYYDN